ncbi:hypothetical protein VDG44_21000 [Xanthomonas campestris pv. raphani]|uniref:hypothetical protein n=1 Tax=Xanthomonas campestris TaxID=339 RepID=UPI002B229C8A|nr:hypothetical protein [Xanthomonas campestris]MEA9906963.1 hypothetical protein [Xanthomonas campestris pv. raphani]
MSLGVRESTKFQIHITSLELVGAGFAYDAAPAAFLQEQMSMKSRVGLIYCMMVVATSVLEGVMKCTASAACSTCGDLFDPFD